MSTGTKGAVSKGQGPQVTDSLRRQSLMAAVGFMLILIAAGTRADGKSAVTADDLRWRMSGGLSILLSGLVVGNSMKLPTSPWVSADTLPNSISMTLSS
jgi:hypothetical protein